MAQQGLAWVVSLSGIPCCIGTISNPPIETDALANRARGTVASLGVRPGFTHETAAVAQPASRDACQVGGPVIFRALMTPISSITLILFNLELFACRFCVLYEKICRRY